MKSAPDPSEGQAARVSAGDGYAMAALLVGLGIMAVMMTVAMPVWKQMAQREKEAELVFRGQQYARAVGLFQRQNHGRCEQKHGTVDSSLPRPQPLQRMGVPVRRAGSSARRGRGRRRAGRGWSTLGSARNRRRRRRRAERVRRSWWPKPRWSR